MSWRLSFLGKVSAQRENSTLSRFESSRAVALLARLALFPRRTHPREELCELLWPEVDPEVARVRLRHTLRTLRVPLEAGLPAGSVLIADRNAIRINPEAITTDVAEFEQALAQKNSALARELYAGELLPGFYDDWVVTERYRLEALAANLESEAVVPVAPPPTYSAPAAPLVESPQSSAKRAPVVPPYLTAFFGREPDKEQVAGLLMRGRLVTLIGLGGTGKTRLSVELFRRLAPEYAEAAFVMLGECLSATQIPGRIRDVLGLPVVEADPLEQVAWKLADTHSLLVLDNLEQLVDSGGAELLELLLARLPQLTLLVTSRRALGIAGEQLYPLEPLPAEDAMALFLDRAQAMRPGFQLTRSNQEDVSAVCQGLEGIPLALELAAARIRAFSVHEMRGELQSRFEWLARTGLRGDKEDRHRSLSAALEWSWRLLPTAQQRFLSELALFRAPWTTEQAAAVTERSDARGRLEALVSDSLIVNAAEDNAGQARFGILETVREFALGKLERPAEARKRFRAHYLAHPTQEENTTTAWEYALDDKDSADAYAFATHALFDSIGALGVPRARDFIEQTLALPTDDLRLRMLATHRLAVCLLRANERTEAIARMDESAAALEREGVPKELLAETLSFQAHIGMHDAPYSKTFALLERCLELNENAFVRAEVLRMKGSLLCWSPESDWPTAERLFDEAQRLYAPDDPGQRRLLVERAHLARRQGDYEEALRLYDSSAQAATRANDIMLYKVARSNTVDILGHVGRWDDAREAGLACLDIEESFGDQHNLIVVLWNLALPFLKAGEPERATKLIAAATALWSREVRPLSATDLEEVADIRASLAEALEASSLERFWAEGEALTLKEALALARASSLSGGALASGQPGPYQR